MLAHFLRQILQAPNQQADSIVERLPLTVCVLLMEVAMSDEEFAEEEQAHILHVLQNRFDLPEEDAKELIELAHDTRQESNDIWHFTHIINESCSIREKTEIMEEIWRIIYVDGVLSGHEDYLVHKIAQLLNMSHPQLIEAKMEVLRELREDTGE